MTAIAAAATTTTLFKPSEQFRHMLDPDTVALQTDHALGQQTVQLELWAVAAGGCRLHKL